MFRFAPVDNVIVIGVARSGVTRTAGRASASPASKVLAAHNVWLGVDTPDSKPYSVACVSQMHHCHTA